MADWQEIDQWDHGVGWIAHPDEMMQRAAHAVEVDGDVLVVDPIDAEGIDKLLTDLGEVAGVVVLLDRHTRDADTIANRHDVPVYIPEWMSGVEKSINAPVKRVSGTIGDTNYRFKTVFNYPMMREAALYDDESGTLIVADALGTADYFVTSSERIGVNPMMRLFPPKSLTDCSPNRILTGHGAGIHENASQALTDAFAGARRRAPSLYLGTVRNVILG